MVTEYSRKNLMQKGPPIMLEIKYLMSQDGTISKTDD